jgi:hypothetical protein
MSTQQINGQTVTRNSTKNNGGSSVNIGSNKLLSTIGSSNPTSYVGVIDGPNIDPAISSGIFANNNFNPVGKKITSSLAGINNNYLLSGALKPDLINSIKSIESRITTKIADSIRNGNYDKYNNRFDLNFPEISNDNFGNDFAARLTQTYRGSLSVNIGNPRPLNILYKTNFQDSTYSIPVTTPSVTPSVTPSTTPLVTEPSVTSSSTPTPTPTPTNISNIFKTSNTANFNSCADWDSLDGNVTTVGSNGISSSYGTYDMGGNLYEWTEKIWGGIGRGIRGGFWQSAVDKLDRSFEGNQIPTTTGNFLGFRIASSLINPEFDFVLIEDENNQADTAGIGAVSYSFTISRFLITNNEYVEFLNNMASTDVFELYNSSMSSSRGGITRSGSSGSYTYSVKANYGNKPANYISWFNAARYCNWLHNNKPSGNQDNNTTENGSYQLTGNSGLPLRNLNAKYFIPTSDEWVKAAFYKGGGLDAGYWNYPTQNNTAPTCILANSTGDGTL